MLENNGKMKLMTHLLPPETKRALDAKKKEYGHASIASFLRHIISCWFKAEGIDVSKYEEEVKNG